MKDKIFGILQRIGRSFMLPIAILPVAGLLLGVGGSLTNETMLNTYHLMGIFGPGTVFYIIFTVMGEAGNVVFANLPWYYLRWVLRSEWQKKKKTLRLYLL